MIPAWKFSNFDAKIKKKTKSFLTDLKKNEKILTDLITGHKIILTNQSVFAIVGRQTIRRIADSMLVPGEFSGRLGRMGWKLLLHSKYLFCGSWSWYSGKSGGAEKRGNRILSMGSDYVGGARINVLPSAFLLEIRARTFG